MVHRRDRAFSWPYLGNFALRCLRPRLPVLGTALIVLTEFDFILKVIIFVDWTNVRATCSWSHYGFSVGWCHLQSRLFGHRRRKLRFGWLFYLNMHFAHLFLILLESHFSADYSRLNSVNSFDKLKLYFSYLQLWLKLLFAILKSKDQFYSF